MAVVVTILDSGQAGPVLTGSVPLSTSVTVQDVQQAMNPDLVQAEAAQPEGTPLQLVIDNFANAGQVAQQLNTQWQQGQLRLNGEPVQAWAGASAIAYANGSQLILQWRKGQPFLPALIWGIVIIAALLAIYLIVQRLQQAPWTLGKVTAGTASPNAPPASFLGIPDWVWLVGGLTLAGLVVAPFVYREAANLVQARGRYEQVRREYGP